MEPTTEITTITLEGFSLHTKLQFIFKDPRKNYVEDLHFYPLVKLIQKYGLDPVDIRLKGDLVTSVLLSNLKLDEDIKTTIDLLFKTIAQDKFEKLIYDTLYTVCV